MSFQGSRVYVLLFNLIVCGTMLNLCPKEYVPSVIPLHIHLTDHDNARRVVQVVFTARTSATIADAIVLILTVLKTLNIALEASRLHMGNTIAACLLGNGKRVIVIRLAILIVKTGALHFSWVSCFLPVFICSSHNHDSVMLGTNILRILLPSQRLVSNPPQIMITNTDTGDPLSMAFRRLLRS